MIHLISLSVCHMTSKDGSQEKLSKLVIENTTEVCIKQHQSQSIPEWNFKIITLIIKLLSFHSFSLQISTMGSRKTTVQGRMGRLPTNVSFDLKEKLLFVRK